jgi:hypothetical protein
MSLVANTAPHLPYLRRFARALTGGQKSGDAYVISVLEALVADPQSFDSDNDPRVELFKAFCRYWNSIEVNLAKDEYEADELTDASRRLERDHAAAAAGVPADGVGRFHRLGDRLHLGISEPEVAVWSTRPAANRQQVATDVLIIEDEPLIAMDIESLVHRSGIG